MIDLSDYTKLPVDVRYYIEAIADVNNMDILDFFKQFPRQSKQTRAQSLAMKLIYDNCDVTYLYIASIFEVPMSTAGARILKLKKNLEASRLLIKHFDNVRPFYGE